MSMPDAYDNLARDLRNAVRQEIIQFEQRLKKVEEENKMLKETLGYFFIRLKAYDLIKKMGEDDT